MKNVLLVSVDALPQEVAFPMEDGLSYTPSLDRIFSTGVSCTNVYSVSFPTQFAMPGLLGGQLPLDYSGYHLGMYGRGATIAEQFRKKGYRTIGITTDYHTSSCYGYAQGFDEYIELHDISWHLNGIVRNDISFLSQYKSVYQISDDVCKWLIDQKLKLFMPFIEKRLERTRSDSAIFAGQYAREIDSWRFKELWNSVVSDLQHYRSNPTGFRDSLMRGSVPLFREIPNLRLAPHYPNANYVFNIAKELLMRRPNEPYFLWVHLTDFHGTLTQDLPGLRAASQFQQFRNIDLDVSCFGRFPQRFDGEGERGNPAALSYVDSEIAKFWEWLHESKFRKPIFAFTADHGDYCNVRHGHGVQNGVTDHLNLYEELLHIPLRIVDESNPLVFSSSFEGLISSKDIGKILSGIAFEGVSSLEALNQYQQSYLLAENAMPGTCVIPFKPIKVAVITTKYKLIWFDPPSDRFGTPRALNIFDRTVDRYESKDLLPSYSNENIREICAIAKSRAKTIRSKNPKTIRN